MPREQENKLKAQGRKKGLKGKALNAYVYGTMNKIKKRKENKRKR